MEKTKNGVFESLVLFVLIGFTSFGAQARDFNKPVDFEPVFVTGVKPELVSIERLKPGLSAVYYLEFFERSLNEIPTSTHSKYRSVTGKPVLELNHQFGKEQVFGSRTNRGVAMRLTGYLYFKEIGEYQLQALSNDGVSVAIDEKLVISDPEQHSDRLSNVGHVSIEAAGYYPLRVEYFQRKGTAALKLFWKAPGSDDFLPIPQNVYVHLP